MSFATSKVLSLLLLMFWLSATSQYEVVTYTRSNGLSSNSILVTKVDSKGIIWFGTSNGISAYTSDSLIPVKSISDNKGYQKNIGRVNEIYEATNGEIWIVSEKGIFIFNGKHWTHFNDTENDGFHIVDVFEDRRGWIWLTYEKHQSLKDVGNFGFSLVEGIVQMYNGFQWIKFPNDIGGTAAITIGDPVQYFTSLMQDEQGNIWFTNLDGTYKFDEPEWVKYDKEILPSDICNKVIETKKHEIWIATKYGVSFKKDSTWVNTENIRGIKGNAVVDLFEDRLGRVWLTTEKDNRFKFLCLFDNGKWTAYSKDHIKLKAEINKLVDYNGNVLAFSKKGISVFDEKKWTNLISKNKIDDNNFSNLIESRNKSIWFAGREGLYKLSDEGIEIAYKPEDSWKVTQIFENKDGDIWVATEKQGAFLINETDSVIYNTDNGLSDNYIKEIFEDKKDNIWIVSKSGISKINLPK